MTDKLKRLLEILTDWLKRFACRLKKLGIELKKLALQLIQFIKSHKKESIIVAAAVIAVTIAIISVCLLFSGDRTEKEEGESDFSWGTGLTEGIPCFSENAVSLEEGESFVAAYYSDVTSEQVASYVAKLDEECGIKFESDHYPRSAVLEDKVIAIHYNVTEMRFSVTVAAKQTETKSDGN